MREITSQILCKVLKIFVRKNLEEIDSFRGERTSLLGHEVKTIKSRNKLRRTAGCHIIAMLIRLIRENIQAARNRVKVVKRPARDKPQITYMVLEKWSGFLGIKEFVHLTKRPGKDFGMKDR